MQKTLNKQQQDTLRLALLLLSENENCESRYLAEDLYKIALNAESIVIETFDRTVLPQEG